MFVALNILWNFVAVIIWEKFISELSLKHVWSMSGCSLTSQSLMPLSARASLS